MMKIVSKSSFLIFCLVFFFGVGEQSLRIGAYTPLKVLSPQSSQLVIYTYESLLADPPYDIEENFSAVSGIAVEDIQILRFGDSNEISLDPQITIAFILLAPRTVPTPSLPK